MTNPTSKTMTRLQQIKTRTDVGHDARDIAWLLDEVERLTALVRGLAGPMKRAGYDCPHCHAQIVFGDSICPVTKEQHAAPTPDETSGSVAQSVYESAVKGRSDFRSAYRQARELLQKFVAAWEGLPGHENMDRLCEIARNFGSSPDHRLVPCPKCGNRFIDAGFCDVCYSPEEPTRDPSILYHTPDATKGMSGFCLPGCPACEFLDKQRVTKASEPMTPTFRCIHCNKGFQTLEVGLPHEEHCVGSREKSACCDGSGRISYVDDQGRQRVKRCNVCQPAVAALSEKASEPNGACGSFKSGYRQGWCVNCGKKGTEHELSSLTTSGPQCNGRCTFDTGGHGKLVLANVDCPLHGLGSAENGSA